MANASVSGPEGVVGGLNIKSAWREEMSSACVVYPEPQNLHKHSGTKEGILQ